MNLIYTQAEMDEKDARIRELAAELAIYKGREEGKQLVINQLEAALRLVRPYVDTPLGAAVDRVLAASTLETKDECTCAMPFDKTPGRHHNLTCPLNTIEVPETKDV